MSQRPGFTIAPAKKISRDRKTLDTFLTYIHSHYTGKISLKDLADAVSVSPGECERLCKRLLHQTPMNYLMTYRIEQSIPLLVNTSYTITEIALQVGFSGASYYTEIFHRIMGITQAITAAGSVEIFPVDIARACLKKAFIYKKNMVF